MTHDRFVSLVRQMRETQRTYFDTRDRELLDRSKSLERQVDRALLEMDQPAVFEALQNPGVES